jgi:hypothetical protein
MIYTDPVLLPINASSVHTSTRANDSWSTPIVYTIRGIINL